MASEQERQKIRDALHKRGIAELTIDSALDEALGKVSEKPEPQKRRCGASLPYRDANDGWRYCNQPSGHTTPHMDQWLYAWEDRTTVEVTSVDEVWSVSDHIHRFSGDDDTCNNDGCCQLTWSEFQTQERYWRIDHE